MKKIFALLLVLALGCTHHSNAKKIPKLESAYLETFFRHLFKNTTAGYVVYGDKPLFLFSYNQIEKTIPGTMEHQEAVIFTQGLKAWESLKVQQKNYILLHLSSNRNEFSESIIIVNKRSLKKAINKNLSLFQFKLGAQMNEETILNKLLTPDGFSTLLKGHEALQGILFGYGLENALTYERGNSLRKSTLLSYREHPPFRFCKELSTPEELKQEMMDYVDNQEGSGQNILTELADFSFYTPETDTEIIPKISFSYHLESDESKNLLKNYEECERTLVTLQKQGDFLTKVLERLDQ